MAQRASLVVAVDEQEHAAGVHHRAHSHGKRGFGHKAYIVVEEARVCYDGVMRKRFLPCARCKRRAGLVERDVAVRTDATHEQFDAAVALDFGFKTLAFRSNIGSITIQDIHILGQDVDVAEEIVPHKGVVALGVVARYAAVFIHVECNHMTERNLPLFVQPHKVAVKTQRRRTGGAAEHERTLCCGLVFIDSGGNIVCSPERQALVVGLDDKTHTYI